MKPKTTLILFVLASLLAGGYYLAQKRIPSTQEMASKEKKLFEMKSAEVTGINIKGADRELAFEKEGDKWNLKKPLAVRASSGEVDGILSSVEYLEKMRTLTPKQIGESHLTDADFGLSKPRLIALLKRKEGDITLKIGNETSQGEGLYIRVGDDPNIYLVNKSLFSRLDKKAEDFREHALFDFAATDARDLEIKTGTKSMEFSKTNNVWRIVQPMNARADSGKVDGFLQTTSSLRAEDFLSEDPAASQEYGLDAPSQEITVRLEKQDALHTLLIGSKLKNDDKKVAARIKGQNSIVSILATYADQASKPLNDFRDHQLANFNSMEVSSIELRSRQVAVDLQKEGDNWKMTQPDKKNADNELVQQFLAKLGSLQIKDFTADVVTDLDKYGLKPPLSGITLKGKPNDVAQGKPSSGGTNNVESVFLGLSLGKDDPSKKITYAKLENDSAVYGLDTNDLTPLPHGEMDLQSRVLLEYKSDSMKNCAMKKGKISMAMEKNPDGKWKLAEKTEGVLDDPAWSRFLGALEHLRVEKILGTALNASVKKYGLEDPVAILTVQVQEEGKTDLHEIHVGKDPSAKKYYIFLKNQFLVAEISEDLFQTLTHSWVIKPAIGAK